MSGNEGAADLASGSKLPPAQVVIGELAPAEYKKKHTMAPQTSSGAVVIDPAGLKRKAPEEEELAKKKKKAEEGGEEPSGGIKEATVVLAAAAPVPAGERAGGKILPKDPATLMPMVRQAMVKHQGLSTVRHIREHLISNGYSRDSILEAKDIIKDIAHQCYPENKEGIKDGEDKPKAVAKDVISQGSASDGKPKDRTGRFTKEEDELLLNAINNAIARVHDGDVDAFKATLCGPKARGDARKKTLSEVIITPSRPRPAGRPLSHCPQAGICFPHP